MDCASLKLYPCDKFHKGLDGQSGGSKGVMRDECGRGCK